MRRRRSCGTFAARKRALWKDSRRVAPANVLHVAARKTNHVQRTQLGESRFHGEIARPEESPCAEDIERLIEHAAIDAAAGEIGKNVGSVHHGGKGMPPTT